tara:strand:- start:3265 stop:5199 length:1935 start_codon:yes stop_codon:yes gene_type:complete
MSKKRFCVLQVTPEHPNPKHVEMFSNKKNSDFYFVTHDAPHNKALEYCPNTTWTDTRNILAAKVPKEYDYYAFIDYDYELEPYQAGEMPAKLTAPEQILYDLEKYNPAVLTYYPGRGMITPFANNKQFRDSRNASIIPFTHCGLKIVHHSLIDWFFPMVTLFGGGVESCHLFNILETPFLSNVVCSHRMIYHNGNTDVDAPHNQDGAYNKYCMDQMWQWMYPSFKKTKLLEFYAGAGNIQQELNDSLLIKKAFQAVFLSKYIEPTCENQDVMYLDKERISNFFDLSHERFLNIDKPVNIQMSEPNKDNIQVAIKKLRSLSYSDINKRINPWPGIVNEINNGISNGRKLTVNECHSLYQTLDNNTSLFIDNGKWDQDLADLLSGKRVAYVGPSPYLMGKNNGSIIDDYDIVVRIQGAIFDEADYGKKTDIIQSCLNANYGPALAKYLSECDPADLPKYIISNDTNARPGPNGVWLDIINEYNTQLKKFNIPLSHLKTENGEWDRWGLYWEIYPKSHVEKFDVRQYTVNSANFNSGYGALNMLSRYPLKELYITGIDFYNVGTPQTAEEKYNPVYVQKFGKEGTPYGPDKTLHDQLGQILHFKNVLLKNRSNINIDKYLEEKINSDIMSERLEKFKKLPKFKHETS